MSTSDPTQDEIRHAIHERFLRIVFNHVIDGESDIRAGLLIHRAGMFKDGIPMPHIGKELIDATNAPDHSHRLPAPDGPYMFVRSPDDAGHGEVIFLPDLLCFPQTAVRDAALKRLETTIATPGGFLCPLSANLLQEYATDIRSDDPSRWVGASMRLDGELSRDFKLNLAGFRQVLATRFDAGIQDRWKQLQTPSIAGLLSIADDHYQLLKSQKASSDFFQELLDNSKTLDDLLTGFEAALGHLPLHPNMNIGAIVRRWRALHSNHGTLQDLHAWTRTAHKATRYVHACNVLIMNPEMLDTTDGSRFWCEFASLLAGIPVHDALHTTRAILAIEADLARFYLQHLEGHTISMDVDRLATVSWWAAHQLSEIIAEDALTKTNPDSYLSDLDKKTLPDILGDAHNIWLMTQSPVSDSRIRYATLYAEQPRLLGLLISIHQQGKSLPFNALSDEHRNTITEVFDRALIMCFPLETEDAPQETWAFDQPLLPAYKTWTQNALDDDALAERKRLVEVSNSLTTRQQRLDALRQLPNPKQKVHTFLVHLFHLLAVTSDADAQGLCQLAEDAQWCDAVLRSLESPELDIWFKGMLEVCRRADTVLPERLVSCLAGVAHNSSETRERRAACFELSIITAAALGRPTALRGLTTPSAQRDFADVIQRWQDYIPRIIPNAPPLLGARLRDVLSSLRSG